MPPSLPLAPDIVTAIESAAIPPVPQVLLRLLEAVENDSSSTETLADLITRDPAIAARVLSAANSAAFRRGKEFARMKDCVQVLGTRIIRTITTCLAVQQTFDPLSRSMQVDLSGFWHHSLSVAEAARVLAIETRAATSEEAYLGGLLHDLGELLLLAGLPEYAEVLAMCPDEASLPQLEQLLFGSEHAATGAWLVDQWQLDSTLADAILFHHCDEVEIATADPLSRLLWVAHYWISAGDLPPTTATLLGLNPDDLLESLTKAQERVEQIAMALGIGAAPDSQTPPSALPVVTAHGLPAAPESAVAAAVRDRALLQPLQSSLFELETDVEILLSLRESARILFGLNRLVFLEYDPANNCLRGARNGNQPALLRQLLIPLDPARSLAARAIQLEQPCASFEQTETLTMTLGDVQLMRGLDAEGLLCVPMRTNKGHGLDGLVGVIAIGLSASQYARVSKRVTWLVNFARLAATTIIAWRESRQHCDNIAANVAGRFERQARRVAHEAGNPLGIIKNYLTLIERKLPDGSPVLAELAILGEEIDRVSRIVESMGTAPSATAQTDLNALVREMLDLYDKALLAPRGISVELNLAATSISFASNADAIKQVLLNLVKNAANAMQDGGKLAVATAAEVFEGGRRFAELRVADNGPGLPADVRQRLGHLPGAQPAGRNGIGLSIVANLVADFDGKLICTSQAGAGTTFSVLIPTDKSITPLEIR